MIDLLATLNDQQRRAAAHTDGALLILAGAGSGKTRVITYRIANLIANHNVAPYQILAVTFTNKAAQEMRERVERLLRELDVALSSAPLVTTFHSLCVRILRRDIERLEEGYTRAFTIYDTDDSAKIVRSCTKDLGFDDQRLAPRMVQSAISHAKNSGLDAELFAARVESSDERRAAIARVFKLYEQRLRANNALDFDDLLIKTVQLLRRVQDVRERYNDKFRYILVDEYQDTNALQFALIKYLTEKTQNICVVGDEDQSVYRFRGADITNILNFEQQFKDATVIRLEQNYRSSQNILDVAGAVVKNNTERKGKSLWTANAGGERIRYYQATDGEMEARFVAGKISEHLRESEDIRCAILYRTNSQSRVFEEALRRIGIAYNIVGGFSFYERAEVKDVVSYLKLALNPQDNIALLRVINSPARGIGKTTLDELDRQARDYGISLWETINLITVNESQNNRLAPRAITALRNFQNIIQHLVDTAQKHPASEVVKAAILDTGYSVALKTENSEEAEARLENLQELVNAAVDFDTAEDAEDIGGLRAFIDSAALSSDTDKIDSEAKVTLLTVHSAKGLEFPVVFVVGLEDGLFPHSRAASDKAELEEERRLMYVAITRAERLLYVTHAMRRRVYGEELASEPSQFLNEMPLELMEDLSRGASWLSFACSSSRAENAYAAQALRGETPRETYAKPAKTYDTTDSIAEFFRQRSASMSGNAGSTSSNASSSRTTGTSSSRPFSPSGSSSSSAASSSKSSARTASHTSNDIMPGMYVRHAKYGRGLVLKREGTGDGAKLTISFPGFGQKKLIEKFANLEKA